MADSSKIFPFFNQDGPDGCDGLPRELRNIIYHMLCRNEKRLPPIWCGHSYGGATIKPSIIPDLLTKVNKQFKEEYEEAAYQTALLMITTKLLDILPGLLPRYLPNVLATRVKALLLQASLVPEPQFSVFPAHTTIEGMKTLRRTC